MKWSVGVKIGAGFSAALVIIIVMGVLAFINGEAAEKAKSLVTHVRNEMVEIDNLMEDLLSIEYGKSAFIITRAEKPLNLYNEAAAKIPGDIAKVRALFADDPAQIPRLNIVEARSTEIIEAAKRCISLRKEKSLEAALQAVGNNTFSAMDEIDRSFDLIKQDELNLLTRREAALRTVFERTRYSIVIMAVLAIFLFLIISFLITNSIVPPLRQISVASERIASGDLDVELPQANGGDEISTLARSFRNMLRYLQDMAKAAEHIARADLSLQVKALSDKDILGKAFLNMVASLRNITREINEGVNILGASASEISTSVNQLVSSSLQTDSAVNETATTVEQVRQTAEVARQKAQSVSQRAQKLLDLSKVGKKSTEDTISEMSSIKLQMDHIQDLISRLNEHSQVISEIIASVDNLAEQSNILAVNAAIEAVKAGEEGKGFSVVAQEIRRLAEQSKQATAQVRAILNDIQKSTSASVMAAEQGNKAVETGVTKSTVAGDAILTLTQNISESSQAAMQIEISSQQQMVGVEQVSIAMENIRLASSQNLSGTKQLETAAENLKELGGNLKVIVEQFRL